MKRRNAETPKRGNGAEVTPGLTKEAPDGAQLSRGGRSGASSFVVGPGVGFVLALAHALLTVLVFPPFDLWPMTFLVPVPLALLALRAPSARSAMVAVFSAQMLLWLWLFRWIMPVTVVGYPFLALYQSLHFVLLVWVLRRVARSTRLARWPMTMLLPVIWTASEFFRGEIAFNGYPWYLLAHPMINWLSFAQSSDLFGAYFITLVTALPAGLAIDLGWRSTPGLTKEAPDRARTGKGGQPGASSFVVRSGVLALLLLIANLAYGQWRLHQTSSLAPGPRILAIQTNLPQDNKIGWEFERQMIDVPEFMRLTREAFAAAGGREGVDLVVWPETMVPSFGFEPQTLQTLRSAPGFERLFIWVEAVESLRGELGVPMLVGSGAWINTWLEEDGRRVEREKEYNSAYLLQGDGPPANGYQRYDKAVLTPFGETMPYISNWPWLEGQLLALGAQGMQFNLDANSEIAVLRLDSAVARQAGEGSAGLPRRIFTLGTPICFEDTVSSLCRKMAYKDGVKRADIFVNISNDGWFGSSVADRKLHAQIARFRCIENRLPMVRCVNTGVSVHFDSAGRVRGGASAAGPEADGSARQPGWLLANVQVDSRRTLYGRIGNAFPAACCVMALGLLLWTFRKPPQGVAAP
jgi:apolipoprotein N-acyltransferase